MFRLSLPHKNIVALCTLIMMIGVTPLSWGQVARFEITDSGAGATRVEANVDWPMTLEQIRDSSMQVLGEMPDAKGRVLALFSNGLITDSWTATLDQPARPQVRLVSSNYDEIPLNLVTEEEAAASVLEAGPAGWLRGQPVSDIEVKWIQFLPEERILRRYRRLVFEVVEEPVASLQMSRQTAPNPHLAVTNSVLSSGSFFKMQVNEEGVYRIDRALLSGIGLDPDAIDPNQIRVFGNGGAPLPALNSAERPVDLVENPILVEGGGDGSFDEGDRVLFYGKGPEGWTYDSVNQWTHYVNPFSVQNVYFLQVDGSGEGKRIVTEPFPAYTDAVSYTRVTGRHYVDFDEFNWSKQNGSGLTWLSNPVNAPGRLDILDEIRLPGLTSGEVDYLARVAIKSNPSAHAIFSSDGTELGRVRTGTVRSDQESPSALLATLPFQQQVTGGQTLSLDMSVETRPNSPQAALDWLRVFYVQTLEGSDGSVRFATPAGQTGRFDFVLSGFNAPPTIWDVTDPGDIKAHAPVASGPAYRFQIEVTDPLKPREIYAFGSVPLLELDAEAILPVENQNLHAIESFPDFVIVAPAPFLPYAEELASRRSAEGLNVLVTPIEKIYNEFSGGMVDMRATRDYFRFLYDRAPSDAQRLKYVLFYGDGHYNYRELGAEESTLANWIPSYETVESLTPDKTFTSDDYFGLLDPDEGEWPYDRFSTPAPPGQLVERLDIGIGRFPVQTEAEAQLMLDKLSTYEDPATFGAWRTRYTFLADDGPTGLSGTTNDADLHLQNADVVAQLVEELYPRVNLQKIYASSFDRVFRNGFRIPEAKEAVIQALEEGTLVVNYSGHGGEEGLAQEEIFTLEDAKELQNGDRLAIFVTATCSFGWWDLATYQSGAEELLLNPNGGAVALLTTVRLVYTSADTTSLNVGLNRRLTQEMFKLDAEGKPRRLGDILFETKNTTVGLQGNNRKFNLLGDPTLRIGIPAQEISVDSLNGSTLEDRFEQMRALDQVRISGSVRRPDGTVDDTFNGFVEVEVFDAERRITIEDQRFMPTPYYTVREDLLWRGEVEALNGTFTARFVVPKDISYSNRAGRISAYAASASNHAIGFSERFTVGGTSLNPPDDAIGPELRLFLNDTTFVSGGLTTPEPRLIVKLFDQSGINTVGAGVGHEMLLVVDDDEDNAFDIGRNFKSEENSFQKGIVEWDLGEQSPGTHTLSLRAWDVLNNSSTATLDFTVVENSNLALRNVFNYPNPMAGATQFVFEHNQPVGTPADIQIRVFTLSGQLVRSIESSEILTSGPFQIPWNGLDEDLDPLSTGIYLYKLRVMVEEEEGGRQVAEHIEKLAVIR